MLNSKREAFRNTVVPALNNNLFNNNPTNENSVEKMTSPRQQVGQLLGAFILVRSVLFRAVKLFSIVMRSLSSCLVVYTDAIREAAGFCTKKKSRDFLKVKKMPKER